MLHLLFQDDDTESKNKVEDMDTIDELKHEEKHMNMEDEDKDYRLYYDTGHPKGNYLHINVELPLPNISMWDMTE